MSLRLAFIYRKFPVMKTKNVSQGKYMLMSINGNYQARQEVVKGHFEQGFLGRAIKLQKMNESDKEDGSKPKTVFILTRETEEQNSDLSLSYISMNFEDLSDLSNFAREGDVLEV